MMDFEDQLRESLRRTEPPAGFADRVIARAAAERDDNRRQQHHDDAAHDRPPFALVLARIHAYRPSSR